MELTRNEKLKTGLVNFFGVSAYIFLVLEWLLIVLQYFYWVQSLSFFPDFNSTPVPAAPAPVAPSENQGSIFTLIFGALITIFMIILSIYALVKFPTMVVKSTKKIVHGAADLSASAALRVQHKQPTKKNRKKLTPKLVIILKAIFIGLAILLVYLSQFLSEQKLEFSLMFMSALWLSGICVVLFVIQYVLGHLLKVHKQLLW